MTVPVLTIDATGIHKPPYADVLAGLVDGVEGIYGTDTYLDADSQDGQMLGLVALAIDDVNSSVVSAYNSFRPGGAQGTGLSSIVKINGLLKQVATNSTCPVLIGGTVGTVITNGQIEDDFENVWNLPATVTIPPAGQITVTATCSVAGAVKAQPGALSTIVNPQPGWQTAVNSVSATPGNPVETDAQLRIRQSNSTMIPSLSLAQGLEGALGNLAGVTIAQVFENDTQTPDANGIPGKCIACVVGGGAVQDIVNTIGAMKGQGVGTYGNTTGYYTNVARTPRQIAYYAPEQVAVAVQVTLIPGAGFTEDIQAQIAAVIAGFINALGLDTDVKRTKLFVPGNLSGSQAIAYYLANGATDYATAAALAAAASATFELVDIAISRDGAAVSDSDITMAFYELASCAASEVVFVLQGVTS